MCWPGRRMRARWLTPGRRMTGLFTCLKSRPPRIHKTMDGRFVRESTSEYSELALPNDANGLGNLLGGKIMHLVDLAGAIAAMKHCRNVVVTASIDHMDFIHPVRIGQWVRLRASVNRAF